MTALGALLGPPWGPLGADGDRAARAHRLCHAVAVAAAAAGRRRRRRRRRRRHLPHAWSNLKNMEFLTFCFSSGNGGGDDDADDDGNGHARTPDDDGNGPESAPEAPKRAPTQ
eukprot:3891436-Pyramimonas_sp.AAC.1